MNNTNFPKKLKQLRKEHHLTQAQLAEKLHVSTQAISKWEVGKSMPELINLVAICDIFGESLDTLLKEDIALQQHLSNHPTKLQVFGQSIVLAISLICILLNIYFYFNNMRIAWFALIFGIIYLIDFFINISGRLRNQKMRQKE